MRIFRIAKTKYVNDFSGEGSRLFGGRWNKIGDPVVYFSEHLSLSLLEIIVHVDYGKLPLSYSFAEVEIPDASIKTIKSVDFIKPKWTTENATNQLQLFGSNWLKKHESLALQVPSAVLQKENNILVNPLHTDFKKLKIVEIGKMDFDPRLLR
jgi:RES domain-containing protein